MENNGQKTERKRIREASKPPCFMPTRLIHPILKQGNKSKPTAEIREMLFAVPKFGNARSGARAPFNVVSTVVASFFVYVVRGG
jgi:hypothetical protein